VNELDGRRRKWKCSRGAIRRVASVDLVARFIETIERANIRLLSLINAP
jgi:hypothetical protein